MAHSTTLSYCGELTRKYDRNRYLCALFVPAELREVWFAIFAFHHEIRHIADTISEEMVGFVRYAWWRETITAVFDGNPPRGHPIAEALTVALRQTPLPKELFDRIINAHEEALAEKQELGAAFLQATAGTVLQLCACAAELAPSPEVAALGTGLAAIEAARLRSMDEEHRTQFLALARAQLEQSGRPDKLFAAFHCTMVFYIRRIAAGKLLPSPPATPWQLTFRLYAKHLAGSA